MRRKSALPVSFSLSALSRDSEYLCVSGEIASQFCTDAITTEDPFSILRPGEMLLSETERASFGKVSPSVLNRMGRRIEETALIALRLLLPEGVKAEKEEFLHSPYDIILISDGKEAYIEVKMALSKSALAKRVANAFRRPHPEPFAVLATVGYFDDPLEYAKAAKLYLSPSNSFRLNERNLRSFLRRCGMI